MNRSSPMTLRVRFSRRCQSAHGRGKPTVSTVSLAKECALRCWQTCAHAARTVGGGDGGQQGSRVYTRAVSAGQHFQKQQAGAYRLVAGRRQEGVQDLRPDRVSSTDARMRLAGVSCAGIASH
jgi:hypothetical protein